MKWFLVADKAYLTIIGKSYISTVTDVYMTASGMLKYTGQYGVVTITNQPYNIELIAEED